MGYCSLQAWERCSRAFLRAQLRAVPSAGSCCPELPPHGLGKRPGFLRASVKLCPPRCSYGSVHVLPQLSPSPFPVLASLEDPAMHGTPWGCCPGVWMVWAELYGNIDGGTVPVTECAALAPSPGRPTRAYLVLLVPLWCWRHSDLGLAGGPWAHGGQRELGPKLGPGKSPGLRYW